MLRKSFVLGLSLFITTMLLFGARSTSIYAQQEATGENFIFINYIGQEIILDLDDVTYTVPGTDMFPEGGRFAMTLPAGEHKFATNVPGGPPGFAGEFTINSGDVVAKAARIDQTGPIVDNKGILVEPPRDFVFVFDFDPFAVPVEDVPVVDTWQPSVATPAKGSLVWINHIGDELAVDLSGTLYKVPAKVDDIPGRVQIDVAPGNYRYTASVPYGSLNSEVTVEAGRVTALNLSADPQPEPEYDVGEEFELLPPVTMNLFAADVTGQAEAAVEPIMPDSAPQTLPNTGGEISPVAVEVPVVMDGLHIKNYAGDTLLFTINNKTFTIPNNTEQTLTLAPGQYTYTASIPLVATTGSVDLGVGRGVELSVAINVNHDVLSVFQN